MELTRIQDIVELELSRHAETRDSDNILYIKVLEYMKPSIIHRPFAEVMGTLNDHKLPSFESVGRARRKLQAEKPWLKPSEAVRKYRADNEEKYREYARLERR